MKSKQKNEKRKNKDEDPSLDFQGPGDRASSHPALLRHAEEPLAARRRARGAETPDGGVVEAEAADEEAVHVAGVGDVGRREAAPGRLVSRSVHVGYVHQGSVLPECVGHGPPDA